MIQIQGQRGVKKHNNQVVKQTRPQAVSYCPLGDKDSSPGNITQVMLFLLVSHIRLLLLIPGTEKRCLYFKSRSKKKKYEASKILSETEVKQTQIGLIWG